MRSLPELLSELGENHLALFIDRADDLRLTSGG